jgi:hypothetical protein
MLKLQCSPVQPPSSVYQRWPIALRRVGCVDKAPVGRTALRADAKIAVHLQTAGRSEQGKRCQSTTTLLHALRKFAITSFPPDVEILLSNLLGEAGGVRATAEVVDMASI